MDTILQTFPLSFLLRSAFSGVFFVLSYCVVTGNKAHIKVDVNNNLLTVALPFALTAGVIVYTLHRSLIYPFIEYMFDQKEAIKARESEFRFISQITINRLKKRLLRRATEAKPYPYHVANYIAAWADYVHLQYVSAWCILFGAITGGIVDHTICICSLSFPPINPPLAWLFIVLFLAASISNWRLHSVDEVLTGPKGLC